MIKFFYLLLLFVFLTVLGQKPLTQEDKIYDALDAFTVNPSINGLQNLTQIETDFWKNPRSKSKNELLVIVVLNCNKAYYENKFGKTSDAISSYEKAWKIYQKSSLSNYDITEYCLKPLGNLYTVLGDYDNAENTIKQYYFIANTTKNNPDALEQKIAAILNLSNVYQGSGRNSLAIGLLENTLKKEALTNVQKGILRNNLGTNYLINSNGNSVHPNDFANAKNSFEKAVILLKNEKNQSDALSNTYRNLASIYGKEGDFGKANSFFEKAKKLFFKTKNQEPRKVAKLYYDQATLLLEEGKLAASSKTISGIFKTLIPNYDHQKKLLPNRNSLYAETLLLDALDLQAAIFTKQNQTKKALACYALCFPIEELFQSLLFYENTQIITQIRIRNRTEKCVALYDLLYEQEKKISYIERAFQLSERTKSVVLKNHLAHNKTASQGEKLYLEELQNWNTTILKEQQKGEFADISKINNAIKKQNELMLLLKSIKSKETKSKEEINIENLFSKLGKDKAILVSYFYGLDKLYIFTLENHTLKLGKIVTSDNEIPKISRFIDYFSKSDKIENDIMGYNRAGNQVYKLLQLPSKTTNKNLVIVPDGLLNFLPFEALITKESTTSNFAKMHYLLNDYTIGYNSSVSFYLSFDTLGKTKERREKTVLGIFPVFANTEYALTFSKDELQSIKHNFEGKFFENSTATFDNFKKNVSDYSILHLSTHASSGDLETPASIKFYDQEIVYSELYALKINPDLVILSACETGLGKLYKSEGALSIARGFQFAGAKNLLFSLWKVNDYTTSVFMDFFYRNIKNNQSYYEANANAKLDFLNTKSIPNAKKSPYYWSAFVYYGELDTQKKPINYLFYCIGFLVLIGLFSVFNRYRK